MSSTLARRDRYFAKNGTDIISFLSTSFGEVGSHVLPFEVTEGGNPEASFFTCLEAQLPVVLSVIRKSCKYASLFSAEAALNLLEGCECQHFGDFADPAEVSIDQDCGDGMSEAV